MELRPGMELFNHGIPVKLESLADEAGDIEFWWVLHLFVAPKAELMEFNKHEVYKSLHSRRVYESGQ